MNTATSNLAIALDRYYEAEDRAHQQEEDPRYNRASAAGWLRDCPRHLVLARLHPEAYVITPEQKNRFREGRRQEEMMRLDVFRAGVKIEGATTDPKTGLPVFPKLGKSFTIPEIELKGEIDDDIEIGVTTGDLLPSSPKPIKAVLEYKSTSAIMFHEVKKYSGATDLRKSTFPWIRHYPDQVNFYLIAKRRPLGILLFKNKDAGDRHYVEIEWNVGEYTYLSDGLQEINARVKKEDVPPILEGEAVCRWCGFRDYCFPEGDFAAPRSIENEDLFLLLKSRQTLVDAGIKAQAKALDDLEDKIKDICRTIPGTIKVGDFLIKMEPGAGRTTYEIPDDIKAKYKKIVPNWKPIRIEYLGGAL